MEYLQVTIKNAKRDDKGIIWRCRVQKSLTETRSLPAFFQCLCECSFPSAIPGSRCIKPRCCCWTGASLVPILGLPSQSHHGHWAAQPHSHFLLFSEPSTSSEVFKFSLHCSCCKCLLSRLSRMRFSEVREVGSDSPGCTTGWEPQPIDLMWVTWERGSSIANARANQWHNPACVRSKFYLCISKTLLTALEVDITLTPSFTKETAKASVHLWTELQFTQV